MPARLVFLGAVLGWLLRGSAVLSPVVATSANPPLTVSGSRPVDAQVGQTITYSVSLCDRDRYSDGSEYGDQRVALEAIVLRSMPAPVIGLRTNNDNGLYVWDVTGPGAPAPGTYLDTWRGGDSDPVRGVSHDGPATARQCVIIRADPRVTAPQRFGGAARAIRARPPGPAGTPAVVSDGRTREETMSAALKPSLARGLTAAEADTVRRGHEVAVPLSRLRPALRERALAYVRYRCRGIGGGTALTVDQGRLAEAKVVILPPPSVALGVDAFMRDGTVLHF